MSGNLARDGRAVATGWIKDLLTLAALVLGIATVGMMSRPAGTENLPLTRSSYHLETCAECGSGQGHLSCPELQDIQVGIVRRWLEQCPALRPSARVSEADEPAPGITRDLVVRDG